MIDKLTTEERLLRELKAARLAIRKMKDLCNQSDEGLAIGKDALNRIKSSEVLSYVDGCEGSAKDYFSYITMQFRKSNDRARPLGVSTDSPLCDAAHLEPQ